MPILPVSLVVLFWGPKKSKYFPTEKDRLFVQVPLQGKLLDKFKAFDNLMSSETMKLKLFGVGVGDSYQYQPLVKESSKGEYMKVKLLTNYDTGDIETGLLVNNEDVGVVESLSEFEKHVPYNSKVRMIVKLVRVWVLNKKFGVTIKAVRVAVEGPAEPEANLQPEFLD